MQIVNAKNILRHREPFLFVDLVFVIDEETAVAPVPSVLPLAKWSLGAPLSLLPAEYAAQVMGVLTRIRIGKSDTVGVLAGISEFSWKNTKKPLSHIILRYSGNRGEFHDFEADFLSKDTLVCAQMKGTVHISTRKIASVVEPINVSEDGAIFELIEINHDGNQCQAELYTHNDCPVYAGHFPGSPITPGVLIAEMMLAVAAHGRSGMGLSSITDLVFKAPIFPGDKVSLSLKEISQGHYSATIMSGNRRLTRARINCIMNLESNSVTDRRV